jgi:hypothetical protein
VSSPEIRTITAEISWGLGVEVAPAGMVPSKGVDPGLFTGSLWASLHGLAAGPERDACHRSTPRQGWARW